LSVALYEDTKAKLMILGHAGTLASKGSVSNFLTMGARLLEPSSVAISQIFS
jgi:hypothetical protein